MNKLCSTTGISNFTEGECSSHNAIDEVSIKGVSGVSTSLTFCDVLGAWKVRLGINRMSYTVEPGLYSVGKPETDSPVLVSANYKLTFDILRNNLVGLDCYLLILDTKGVNVWCAAGEGTFSTDELVNRIQSVGLSEVINHRHIILPQLCASGVNANEVMRRTGYSVTFGPVRAKDIKAFISSGNEATKEMRLVEFGFRDRLILTPLELIPALRIFLPVVGTVLITNTFAKRTFNRHDLAALTGAVITGSVVTPLLLPYIPGRSFAWKGWILGVISTAGILIKAKRFKPGNRVMSAGQLLLLPIISSYLAMNFTGASTYTSPSGVKKEMKKALPFIIGAGAVGAAITLGAHFFRKEKK